MLDTLIQLLILVIAGSIVGYIIWVIVEHLPIPAVWKNIIYAICGLIALVVVLQFLRSLGVF